MIIKRENIACLMLDKENRCLLIQRNSKEDSLPGFWELPSGGIDKGEEMNETVRRETLEEVGVDISGYNLKQVDSENYSFKKENGDVKNVTETTFIVILNERPNIILSQEHVDYQWVTLEELDSVFEDKDDLIYKRVHRIFSKEDIN